jgi:hypothetical protein
VDITIFVTPDHQRPVAIQRPAPSGFCAALQDKHRIFFRSDLTFRVAVGGRFEFCIDWHQVPQHRSRRRLLMRRWFVHDSLR